MTQTALRRGSQSEGNTEYFTGCPIGGGFMWYGLPSKIPSNCRVCDNTTLAIASFTKLHENLGGAWGTDGTNLNVPDLRGRMPRGVDGGVARDPDRASRTAANTGGNTGDAVGSVQLDAFTSHDHGAWGNNSGSAAPVPSFNAGGNANYLHLATPQGGSTETRPKNANVYFVIRVS